jgi:hypothetical protein
MDSDLEAVVTVSLHVVTQVSVVVACWSFVIWVWGGA